MRTISKKRLSTENIPVDVSPDMQFYNLLEHFPYDFTKAISEYIDNALQAFLDAQTKNDILDILIEFYSGNDSRIIITDNGVGIAKKDFQDALKPAKAKEIVSLSEFGIGMKAASIWFGRKWELISSPYDSDESYKVSFDLDELISNNKEEIMLETVPRKLYSGVIITLNKLRRDINKERVIAMWEKLQETYQLFTHIPSPILNLSVKYDGVTLNPNNELINEYRNPKILKFPMVKFLKSTYYAIGENQKWETNIDFIFDSNRVIGKLVVLETSSQATNPGIRLYRNKRLMKGFITSPNRPQKLVGTANKHAPSRIFGELHLDGQKVSNNKSDFLFDENYFLSEFAKQTSVKDFIDQAENYRAKIETDKIHYISKAEFDELNKTKKVSIPKIKKAILTLFRNQDEILVGKQIDLYEYIDTATSSDGHAVDYCNIRITINDVENNNFLTVSKCNSLILFSFVDEVTGEVSSSLSITGVEQSININNSKVHLIPQKAAARYQLNIRPVLNLLVSQINELYINHTDRYNEVIACSLRSCFELSLKAVNESADIHFDNPKSKIEDKIYSIHLLMKNRTRAEIICKDSAISSYHNFLNEWESITETDLRAYISCAHLGAHGSTDSLPPDRVVGIGNYLGLFLLAIDQLLNNKDLQVQISTTIPIVEMPK